MTRFPKWILVTDAAADLEIDMRVRFSSSEEAGPGYGSDGQVVRFVGSGGMEAVNSSVRQPARSHEDLLLPPSTGGDECCGLCSRWPRFCPFAALRDGMFAKARHARGHGRPEDANSNWCKLLVLKMNGRDANVHPDLPSIGALRAGQAENRFG
jgi:hypothetical protein